MNNIIKPFHFNKARTKVVLLFLIFAISSAYSANAQNSWNISTEKEERPLFSEHYSSEEFAERRQKVFDEIGDSAIAIVLGAPSPDGYQKFRQNNEFYYLSGIESPEAFLILNGNTKETTIYFYNRKERREYGEGKMLSYEDGDLVRKLSGIENTRSYEGLLSDLKALNNSAEIQKVYTHFSPYEGLGMTRGMANRVHSDAADNPLISNAPRHKNFISELERTTPDLVVLDLDPITDELRKIKSNAELEQITRSTLLQAEAIMESMRSTEVGIKPFELEAVAKYIYWKHNLQGDAYYALVHFGPDAYMNHYHGSVRTARDGDMILMDYGAYDGYYTSDLARMWPVNGKFNDVQKELYSFYLKFYEAILYNIKPGITPQKVMQNALVEIDEILKNSKFSNPAFENAAKSFVESYHRRAENPRMSLGHGVGMSPHDVGSYSDTLKAGMVFTIEPQFRVPEYNIYVRLEDMIVITDEGVDILSDFLPRDIETIESLMREEGMLQKVPISID